jgi:predicted nucleic acid-binding protein
MKYLLDTNIVSELSKKVPNTRVLEWIGDIPSDRLFLSCITIGELKVGALKKAHYDPVAGRSLIKWIEELMKVYEEQILLIDLGICQTWAELLSIDSTNAIDSLLLAQAITNNMVLVTRNTKHFKSFGAKCFNPFGEGDM